MTLFALACSDDPEGFGSKSVENLIQSINSSRNIELHRFIFGLGIEEVGETTARNLSNHFKGIEKLMSTSFDELITLDDIGPRVASNIMQFFENDYFPLHATFPGCFCVASLFVLQCVISCCLTNVCDVTAV